MYIFVVVCVLEYDTGGGTAERQTDGDDGGPALLPLLLPAAGPLLPGIGRSKVSALAASLAASMGHFPSLGDFASVLLSEEVT